MVLRDYIHFSRRYAPENDFFHISASNDLDLSPLDRRIALPVTDDVDNISCKFRSDISAGNSLSVPQYSVVPFFYTDVLIYLCHMLFTEKNKIKINAATVLHGTRQVDLVYNAGKTTNCLSYHRVVQCDDEHVQATINNAER